ncbi:hypothetical protein GM661_09815 [Iocasia frigidifontis]|uniref:Nucleotidase n=1 Tax=Iocasia fonsfrigidae TaxID=2682810 RepID=A0A8A7KJE8_9FIRM|nr:MULTISPECIES: hypothetical protein [Halanaerobiaceae]AZO95374.1 hypothetical protein D7D81_12645 [Halocella sp. SP3-1]MTI61133.1 hypothetical protein [Bacillota bacterium]QTL98254.1 hypothetical protein GM661_09815 [Iocasia fonsfrigidae]
MKKIIGFDIDGVITDEEHENDNIWHDAICNFLGYDIVRKSDSYLFDQAYDISSDVINKFLDKNLTDIYSQVKPVPLARETIRKLYNYNFEVNLITARDQGFKGLTTKWLKKHQIPFTKLIHNGDKVPHALAAGIELFVEDNAENARAFARNNIPVILINKYHNKFLETKGKSIYRVDNWQGVCQIINDFFKINFL